MTTLLAVVLVLIAFLVAFATLLALGLVGRWRASGLRQTVLTERGTITFLFENETLVDVTTSARDLLATAPKRGSDWSRLSGLLEPRFPGLDDWIFELADLGEMERQSNDETSLLHAEWHDGIARITLSSLGVGDNTAATDQYTVAALNRELETLRAATERTPFPIWEEDEGGAVTWCNSAYLDLLSDLHDNAGHGWPPTRIFDIPDTDGDDFGSQTARVAVSAAGDESRHWFEVHVQPNGSGRLCTATPTDDLVKAETSLNEFVTTLSKTFAALPIGIAIFNRSRELAMFNPALVDLMTLPVDFLISKPTLASFLDRLREMQMMPEPKDYKSWRQRVSDLVAEARNGTYEDKWTLPGGQTYRVTGRPHPDGAVAFLFEDISTEIELARKHRAEIETAQATLDAMPAAVAVFSTAGVLTLSNAQYATIWASGGAGDLTDLSIYDSIEHWRNASAPSGVWDEIRATVGHAGVREPCKANITLLDGRALTCRVAPLPRGFTLIEFAQLRLNDGTAEVPEDVALQRGDNRLLGVGS
ncbi:PAS-domain containing protein [Maritimibacter sp. UBA3975]|uniref:PAS-domain containing protein n=1 Tax=Maritimibacter sp. UBA3975 TaxID=1946833 RepID=UPI000C0A40A4|nr:PAS-domain containing protein [Maritimibacter sp. UBA3975]MAM63405.1 diguanylate cyclase [Maritimibacter sp.]|tara:strand:- start:74482 stop:76080 length:1599 start_codon:yes stop_codon:yes gene_type:complete